MRLKAAQSRSDRQFDDRNEFRPLSARHFTVYRPNGEFSFSTYRDGDRAKVGTTCERCINRVALVRG